MSNARRRWSRFLRSQFADDLALSGTLAACTVFLLLVDYVANH